MLLISKKKLQKTTDLKNKILNIVNLTVIIPVLMGMIYAMFFFRLSFSSIFNNNISKVLHDSALVANAYYEEYKDKTLGDASAIAASINDNTANVLYDNSMLKTLLESYANLKELSDAVVFVPDENLIIAKNDFSSSLLFDFIPQWAFDQSEKNKPILIENLKSNKIKALIELENFPYKTYLLVSRYMDDKVVKYLNDTKNAVGAYDILNKKIHSMQALFLGIFAILLVFLILISRFVANFLTKKLVNPIDNFVYTTKIISKGDLSTRVVQKTQIEEMDIFIESFNHMLNIVEDSKSDLNSRNNFIEAIISQIPSGLVLMDEKHNIILHNGVFDELKKDEKLPDLFLKNVISIIENNNFDNDHHVVMDSKHFLIKAKLAQFQKMQNAHYLIIFTDISEHIAYQKNLVWTDIAKRITHEIRNPLTPIILSADRIYDKFLSKIDDKENFEKYLSNIKRYANDIALIIDEFIRFGRMPDPVFAIYDLRTIIENGISGGNFDQKITYHFDASEDEKFYCKCDEKQILRALLNVFKNSYEAMDGVDDKFIKIKLSKDGDKNHIEIVDNGPGFSEKLLDRITEPYVSTKVRGSGLGLSIVKKIVDDHGGKLIIKNSENHNGMIIFIL